MVLNEHRCPHCRKKANYFDLLKRVERVYYHCKDCKNFSFLKLDENIKSLFVIFVALSFLLVVLFSFVFKRLLVGTVLIILLFLSFYLLTPLYVYIRPQDD